MSASQSLRAEAAKRIIIKDGAYGTSIQARTLQTADYCGPLDLLKDPRGNNDLLNITRPDVGRSICESFADAGAEILATNTFNANAISQADYAAEALVTKINIEAAQITRAPPARMRPLRVVGSGHGGGGARSADADCGHPRSVGPQMPPAPDPGARSRARSPSWQTRYRAGEAFTSARVRS